MTFTKISTLLSILTLSAITIPSAYAGEVYVTNTDRNSWGNVTTDVNVDSKEWSRGHRYFDAYAEKIYIDGDIKVTPSKGGKYWQQPASKTVSHDGFTVHTAEASEFGHEHFGSDSKSKVKVWSFEQYDEHSHTSASGTR